MNYYGARELAASFRTVRNNTIQIAQEIPEDKYGLRATPETRSVAETLIHIAHMTEIPYEVHGVRKLTTLAGFDFMGFLGPRIADEKAPHSKAAIVKMLTDGGDHFTKWLETLSDEFLGQRVESPFGPSKSRFEMLLGTKEHEMHHRAQLMVLERLAGITPHLTRQMQERMAQIQAQAAKQ